MVRLRFGTAPRHPERRLSGRLERAAAAGVLGLVTLVSVTALLSTHESSRSVSAATATANRADLYQDSRYFAAAADGAFDDYLAGTGGTSLTETRQADAHLASSLKAVAMLPSPQVATAHQLQRDTVRLIALRALAERRYVAGLVGAALRIDHTQADVLSHQVAVELGQLEEAAHLASQAQLRRAQHAGHQLALATPVVLGGSILVGLLLVTVLGRYRRRVELLATTDSLTSLPNRLELSRRGAALLSQLSPTESETKAPVLLLLDLDRFKEVNDSVGHHFGDQLLIQVARRITGCIKSRETVARLGGDEFAVLLTTGGENAGQVVATRIRESLRKPFTIDDLTVEIDVSIGIALASAAPGGASDLASLLRCADVAMYAAKELGGGYVVHTALQDAQTQDKIQIISELRRAIDHDELVVHYQPKVALDDGRLLGVEALVRWQHPTRGLLPPGAFLPIVEDSEVIDQITFDVLTKSLHQMRRWAAVGHEIPISVNVAPRSLLNLEVPSVVARLLERFEIDPALLCLEITETALMRNPQRSGKVLKTLRDLGVRLSIDDYGTGYASMTYLRELPIDELKIDASFITQMGVDAQSAILARSVVELGHNLGLSVVAEGVEDAEVGRMLESCGCDVAQGYFYARPMPAGDLLPWELARSIKGAGPIPVPRRPEPDALADHPLV
jgi:diguanylate cyclase (GGDEF)-like protein